MTAPRILVAGLRGGGGKTLVSLGLLAAWRRQDRIVAPFKKGPDYIDAAWLSQAAGKPCRNLDLYLMTPEIVARSFAAATHGTDVAVIEGNRGLYDGMDAAGTYSSAELAKLLRAPVLLTVDCTKSTRTIAALVLGCQRLDPEVVIAGTLLNRIGSPRHESVVRRSVESTCSIPVVGALPRIEAGTVFPERHLGLVPPQEHDAIAASIEGAADAVARYVDLEAVLHIAQAAPALPDTDAGAVTQMGERELAARAADTEPRIGVFRDAAFQFYYPENLEALRAVGGHLIEISPIREKVLPPLDALYIGGGFPETMAAELAANVALREQVRGMIEDGLPVYAECGGTVYLGRSLIMEGREYPMVGALPVHFGFGSKPQGHGYVEVETTGHNPYFPVGTRLRGHEFHYTRMLPAGEGGQDPDLRFAFRVLSGFGFDGERDGLCWRNVLASYTHVHALGVERWASSILQQALVFRSRR